MKNIIPAVILLFACTSTNAQLRLNSNFGIKAGVQAAKLGQPSTNWDSKYKWHAGLLAHIHISDHFAVQPELIYSAQGAEHITPTTETQIELNYVNLPIVLQYMTSFGLRIQAGPQIGVLMKAKGSINGAESDIKDFIKSTDFGVLGGLSYLTKLGLGFDARYVYGLTDIAKNGNGAGSDINNLVIQLGAFYQFKR